MEEEKTVEIPLWIVDKVLMTLMMMNDCVEEECCLKRQICSSYRLLNLYKDGSTPDEKQMISAIVEYASCKLE